MFFAQKKTEIYVFTAGSLQAEAVNLVRRGTEQP